MGYILYLLYCTDVVDISFTFWPLDFSGCFFLFVLAVPCYQRNTIPLGTVDRQCGMRLHTGRRQQEQEEEEEEEEEAESF